MTGINKNILRAALVISYILVIALVVFGISSLFSYLNTGADRSSMLHTEIKKVEQYLPKITWAPLNNEGRSMDAQTLEQIQDDYLDAWYVKQVSYKTNTTVGIDDYYTESARKNIYDNILLNKKETISVESTTLEHHPTLEFFSEDGQLAVITDYDVVEYKRVLEKGKLILETSEQSTYKIILLLEDGFWRIRHLVKKTTKPYKRQNQTIATHAMDVKGINYYPQKNPWQMFNDDFSKDTISKDFKIIKDAGLNSVRIFVPYEDFGKATIDSKKLDKLEETLNIAKDHNLKVLVTLFDFYGDYSVLNWTLNHRHAEVIVNKLKHHPALLGWDIKNEPNLDFESRNTTLVTAWLNSMIDLVKSIDENHPITIGWSNAESANILQEKVDFVSFHYYEDLDSLEKVYLDLKESIPNKPTIITEFGLSSYRGLWSPFGNSENDQAEYHQEAQTVFAKNNIQFMSWTLYDYNKIPKEVVGRLPWRKQAQGYFGFIDQNGETKPAFKYISGK